MKSFVIHFAININLFLAFNLNFLMAFQIFFSDSNEKNKTSAKIT
jgi:hypothetical protein